MTLEESIQEDVSNALVWLITNGAHHPQARTLLTMLALGAAERASAEWRRICNEMSATADRLATVAKESNDLTAKVIDDRQQMPWPRFPSWSERGR